MRISDWSSDVCSSDLQLLQPGGAQRLLERVAVARAHDAVLVHVAHQPPVDRGQPLGTAILTQPRLDFEIGAWTQVERRQAHRAFANPVGDIFARDDEVVATIVAPAQHDVRSEEHTSELQSLMRNSYAV